ncbi:MAG: PaaI family thioesterase [Bacteroidales bacterium]
MEKISNPYRTLEGYDCFGCSPDNPIGLKMEFYEDGDGVVSTWQPTKHYQGFKNVLHGGIQATMMDEIASWAVSCKLKTAGLTSRMEIRFLKPVHTHKGPVTLRAKIDSFPRKRLANVGVLLFNEEDILCAEAMVQYYIFPPDVAKERLNFRPA